MEGPEDRGEGGIESGPGSATGEMGPGFTFAVDETASAPQHLAPAWTTVERKHPVSTAARVGSGKAKGGMNSAELCRPRSTTD